MKQGPLRRVTLAATIKGGITERQKGGFLYNGIGQFYNRVNDHLMYFHRGSGAKTISERVTAARVAIVDGHPTQGEASRVLGKVVSAEETPHLNYVGLISATEFKIAAKIGDGTIDENSLELVPLDVHPKKVKLEQIPEGLRGFVNVDKDGMVTVRGVRAYRWDAIGLVYGSSQDAQAIFAPPTVITSSNKLSVTRMPWAPRQALDHARNWSGGNAMNLSAAHLAEFYDQEGELVLADQIAEPRDDELVVNVEAIPAALVDVEKRMRLSGLSKMAQDLTIEAAHSQATACLIRLGENLSALTVQLQSGNSIEGAAEIVPSDNLSIATATAGNDTGTPAEADSQTTAGPATPPTVGSKEASITLATEAHLDLMRLADELQFKIPTVGGINEPTGTGRGPARPDESGRRGDSPERDREL